MGKKTVTEKVQEKHKRAILAMPKEEVL